MKRNLVIGLFFSVFFVYLALKNINISELKVGIKQADYCYLIPIFLISTFILYVRSYRWGIILNPLEKMNQRILFPIMAVGLMAVVLLPVRMGEFVRPYLVSKHSEIRMSSALGTVVVERVFDGLTLMLFLLLVTYFAELPRWTYQAGLYVTIFFVLTLLFLALLICKRDFSLKWAGFLLKGFPDSIAKYLMRMLTSFANGLKVLPDPKRVVLVVLLSILVWSSMGFCIYLLFLSFHFGLPLIAAYVVLVLTALGIMVPTAPGFVGNFHLFCVIGLALFGISKTEALSFAVLLHLIQIGIVAIIGLAFVPIIKIPFSEVFGGKETSSQVGPS